MSHHHALNDPLLDDPVLFKQLTAKPVIAWPSIIVLVVTVLPILALDLLAITGHVPAVMAGLIAGCLGYFTFSAIHDGLHRSVSTINWLNESVCVATNFLIFPYLATGTIRWGHMQHHRFAGEPGKDPDMVIAKSIWRVLTVGLVWDFYYVGRYFVRRQERPASEVRRTLFRFISGLLIIAAIAIFLPVEALIFWVIASRLGLLSIAFIFMYLPHQPHGVQQKDALYQATLIRTGWDWLMTTSMAYQNWHLVHHLYPTVPFYRYKKVWNAKRNFHESQHPARVRAFALTPYDLQLPKGVKLDKH